VREVKRTLPDGTIEETREILNRTTASGNAKQVIEKTRLSLGKTQSIGISGVDQESQSPFHDMVELMRELKGLSPTQ
jgi:hypothetical protein